MSSNIGLRQNRAERRALASAVKFEVNGEVMEGATVNISETGLRIDTAEPLDVTLRFVEDNQQQKYRLQLVWAAKKEEGGMTYGLSFLDD